MIYLRENTLLIEISTENPASYLIQLQRTLNNIIVSVAESPELNSSDDVPEAICKLRELQSELMLSEEQLKKIFIPEEQ